MLWGGPQLATEDHNSVINETEERNSPGPSLKRPCVDSSEDVAKKPHLDTNTTGDTQNLHDEIENNGLKEKVSDGHSVKKECRRLISGLIHIVYNRQHSIFEVTKKSKNYLAVMGVPLKNNGHILFPEEAVFLIEHCNAYATDDGNILTLHDGYRILGECGVPMHVYRAYASLRQVGFVVLRPGRAFVHSLPLNKDKEVSQDVTEQLEPKCERYPQRLLDCFPTVDHHQLLMPSLHRSLLFVPIPDLRDFNTNHRGLTKLRRWQRNFRQTLRPRWWPEFNEIRDTASNWSQFGRLRRKLIESTRKAPPPISTMSDREYNYDFEVFLPDKYRHTNPSKAVFHVKCVDSRDGTMSCSTVNQFYSDVPLVLSIFDCGHVCFVETSGESIDLNQYLRGLVEKFEKL